MFYYMNGYFRVENQDPRTCLCHVIMKEIICFHQMLQCSHFRSCCLTVFLLSLSQIYQNKAPHTVSCCCHIDCTGSHTQSNHSWTTRKLSHHAFQAKWHSQNMSLDPGNYLHGYYYFLTECTEHWFYPIHIKYTSL